ncbi:hypothetical protein PRNP1_001497 [Phytophthora ramorum]
MASNKENVQNPMAPAPASAFLPPLPTCPPLPTFPPLPPFPPSDASESRQSMEPTQRHIHHHYQYFPSHWTQRPQLKAKEGSPGESRESIDTKKQATGLLRGADDFEPPTLSLTNPPPPKPRELSPKKSSTQFGRTIWSINPEELSALAVELAATRQETAEPSKKLSYAEASKRNLPGFSARLAAQADKAVKVEEPPMRAFKKYYGLPIIPLSGFPQCDFTPLEEKESPTKAYTGEETYSNVLDYSQSFGLSANTPTFYPRQTTASTDLLQMLKTSLAPKKIAPHMDWWPGDWKCTNCALTSYIPEAQNFSYRFACFG